ncbi:type 4b pilus protein PilO2 [Pseudomonas sp. AB12(2023)]|uniref:type 4b pilus protein PilO2 n=1 Tax=Pseudomonas sp. AB12(2023) TaxID=3048597 RepID=UPI002B22726B|nr:type 4b pilus protein PilO2 [Pseudomonas sp. AB12(2023)]MEB0222090.1 type 4b pilus protein PilO2 [Pseudomonas sp. AB12(2023)]
MATTDTLTGAAGPSRRLSATIVTINGQKFVSGLLWQSLARPRSYMKEAKEFGKSEGLDIVAIRDTAEVKQAGFVSKADGAYKGMYSLAASLAGQLGDTWIGVFKLTDDQYAIVAVVSGAIVPGADKIGDLASVEKHLRRLWSRGTDFKNNVYAPAEMGFGGQELNIEELLIPSKLKKEYRLRPLTFGLTKKELIGGGCLVVLAVCLLSSGWQWHVRSQYALQQAKIQAAKIELQRLSDLNAKTRVEQVAPALKHPWASRSGVGDFVSACLNTANKMPLALGGWIAMSANCKSDIYAITYVRQGASTVSQVITAAKSFFELAPAFTNGGDIASLNKPLEMNLAGDEELTDLDTLLAVFNSHFQQLLIKPELVEVPYKAPPVAPALPGSDGNTTKPLPPPAPDWIEFSFKVVSHIPPEILVQGLPGRGVRINEIDIDRSEAAQLTWTIYGAIYAKK